MGALWGGGALAQQAVGRGPPAAPAGPIWPQMAPLHAPPTQTTQNLPFAHKPQPWGAAWVQKRPFAGRFGQFSAQALPFWLPLGCPPTNRWHCSMPPGTPQAHWGQMGTMPGPHRALKPQQLAKKCKKRHFWPFQFQHFLAPRTFIVFARLLLGHCHII